MVAQHFDGKLIVRPQSTIRHEHAFGVGSRSGSVVNHGQRFAIGGSGIVYVLFAEEFGILLTVKFVEPFAGFGESFVTAQLKHEIGDVDDALQSRHRVRVECGPNHIAHKEQTGIGVVDNVVHLLCLKLMEDGHRNGAIGQRGQESHRPMCTIAAANGNFITGLNTGIFKEDVQFLDFARYVFILQRSSFVVGQRRHVPVVNDAFLNQPDVVLIMVFHEKNKNFCQRTMGKRLISPAQSCSFCAKVIYFSELARTKGLETAHVSGFLCTFAKENG